MLLTGFFQQVEQVVLHFDRVVQFPAQLAGIGHTDRVHGAHAQFDLTGRQPWETLVGQSGFRIGVFDDLFQNVTRLGSGDGEDAPLGGHVLDFDIAELLHLVFGRLAQIVRVIFGPGTGRDDVVVVLAIADDGVFGAGGAVRGQRIGQVDTTDFGQLVAGEPIQELGRTGAFDDMLGKGRRVDQANAFADRLGFVDGVFPPATATEAAAFLVKVLGRINRREIVRAFPTVHPAELSATGFLAVIGRNGPQRTAGRALFVGVVQDIDMLIAFFVLARRELGGHPVGRIPLGVQRGHVDLGFAIDHHLRQIVAGATGSGDAKAKALGQPHVAQTRSGANQRVAIRRIADRAVEIVFQAGVGAGGHAFGHRHILIRDSVDIQREQVSAEAIGHTVFELRRRAVFVDAQNPTATFFTGIGFIVGVADNGVLGVAGFAPFDQLGVFVHDDESVFDRDGRHLDAQHLGGALRVVARCGHDMLSRDHDLLVRRHQVAAFFDHLGAGDFPVGAVPVERIGLHLAHNIHAALTGTFGHRLSHIGGVNIAVFGVVDRTLQVRCFDQRPAFLDLLRRQPLIGDIAGLGCGRIEHVFVHTLLRLRHAQVAHHGEACVQAGFFLKLFVEIDGVLVDVGCRIGHVEQRQQTGCVPGRARCQLVPFDQHHIIPARLGQVICNRGPNGAAANDQCFDLGFHNRVSPHGFCCTSYGAIADHCAPFIRPVI